MVVKILKMAKIHKRCVNSIKKNKKILECLTCIWYYLKLHYDVICTNIRSDDYAKSNPIR